MIQVYNSETVITDSPFNKFSQMRTVIHSSDLHLGRRFGQFPADVAAQLAEARFDMIERLAAQARNAGAPFVILAGDTWDSETPSDRVLRQSLERFAAQGDIRWLLLPGNHDPLGPAGLWERVTARGVPNIQILNEAAPTPLDDALWVLPAPCQYPVLSGDPTAWMASATTPDGALRLGIAHGGVQDFGDTGSDRIIAPDRETTAGLDYLALGDWHGWTPIGQRTLYSGTPEPDRFRAGSGLAAGVSLSAPGAAPDIRQIPVGRFLWLEATLDPELDADAATALERTLGQSHARSDILLSLTLRGTVSPEQRTEWLREVEDLRLSLKDLRLDDSALTTLATAEDLDLIDRQGALRAVADRLLADSRDDTVPPEDREAAALALDLLFTWSAQDAQTP